MTTVSKILLGVTTTVVVLIVLASIAITYAIDPNNYKGLIQDKVGELTGKKFSIGGDIEWQLLPTLGLKLQHAVLAEPDQATTTEIASIKNMEVQVKLWPLFEKQLIVDKVSLDGLKLQIMTSKTHPSNLQQILEHAKKSHPETKPQAAASPSETTANSKSQPSDFGIDIRIAAIEIKNSTLSWLDEETGNKTIVRDINFHSSHINMAQTTPLELSFKIIAADPKLEGQFTLKTQLHFDQHKAQLGLNDLALDANLSDPQRLNTPLELHISAQEIFVDKQPTLNLSAFKVNLGELTLSADVKTQTEQAKSPALIGHVTVPDFDLHRLITRIDPKLLPKQDHATLRKVGLAIDFSGTPQQLAFDKLQATLDKSILTGKVLLVASPELRFDFDLNLNEIDLDKYLPLTNTKISSAQTTSQTTKTNPHPDLDPDTQLLGQELLNALRINGQLKIQRLKVAHLTAGRVNTKIRAAEGTYRIGPMKALLYEGHYQGMLAFHLKPEQPNWQLSQEFERVNLRDLLTDYNDLNNLSGYATVKMRLTGQGLTPSVALPSLQGTTNLQLDSGAFEGLDLSYQWQLAQQFLGKSTDVGPNSGRTEIANLKASWAIQNGIAQNQDLILYNDKIYAQGNGSINLMEKTLAYRLLTSETQRNQNNSLVQPRDIGLPIQLNGPIAAPEVSLDVEQLKKMALQKAGKKLIEKVLGNDQDNQASPVGSAVEGLLKGLIGQ